MSVWSNFQILHVHFYDASDNVSADILLIPIMSGVNLSRLSCPNADYPGPSEVLEPILQHR